MRGAADKQKAIFHTFELNDKIPAEHPLRVIKKLADAELKRMAAYAVGAAYNFLRLARLGVS